MKVHVVEDDPDLLKAITYFLQNNKIEVSFSRDGASAAKEVVAAKPDAVLLDIMLTGKSGYEIAEELHELKFDSPVIVMSNLDTHDVDRPRLEAAGVGALFLKSNTQLDDIIEEIVSLISKKQG